LFPISSYNVEVKPLENETHLDYWKRQVRENIEIRKIRDNKNHIKEVLSANDQDCDDLSSISAAESQMLWFSTITFKALDDIKESLQEMVMLPLRCPDLF
jgi:hypothetical protein